VHATPPDPSRPALREALAIWVVLAAVGVATFVTYTRLPPDVLYLTTFEGLAGGASRTLVYLNYPVALVALGVLPLAVDRLLPRAPRLVGGLAVAAALLCAVVAVPGVVDPEDLDAKPVNAVPALGVALVLGLFAWALRAGGAGPSNRPAPGDRLRLVLVAVLVVMSIPWLFAEAGFYAPWPFLTETIPPGEELAAVHLGRHHGMDGVLLALAALGLSRSLGGFRSRRLALGAAGLLSLMLAYGVAIAAEDWWLEQVVKRGWTDARLPDMVQPSPSPGWAVIVLAAAAILVLWFRPGVQRERLEDQEP
jgi:hypothetical protein